MKRRKRLAIDILRYQGDNFEIKAMKSSTNFGFQDTSVALRYINANIKSFGGDPDRITITGILKKKKYAT